MHRRRRRRSSPRCSRICARAAATPRPPAAVRSWCAPAARPSPPPARPRSRAAAHAARARARAP
ncbi:hypothetical protein DWU95_47440, partial [Burkholderia contaminans]